MHREEVKLQRTLRKQRKATNLIVVTVMIVRTMMKEKKRKLAKLMRIHIVLLKLVRRGDLRDLMKN